MQKRKILILTDHYLPGSKAGGKLRLVVNLVEALGNNCDLRIITSDRDLGDSKPYESVRQDEWQQVGNAQVFYASRKSLRLMRLKQLINETPHDIRYVTSIFSPRFTIIPLLLRRFGLLIRKPFIVSMHGELAPRALRFKRLKKRFFLAIARLIGLYKGVTWHATNKSEEKDIRANMGEQVRIAIALEPLNPSLSDDQPRSYAKKSNDELSIIFLSRISPIKNLTGALDILAGVKGKISFNIYGPIEDAQYWKVCQEKIEQLPDNISVEYHGHVEGGEVINTFNRHHILLLPTHGENFGYVILESFIAGCPVILSDTTPWRGLADEGIGWDLPLEEPDKFRKALQQMVDMDNKEYQHMAARAREFGIAFVKDHSRLEAYHALFNKALEYYDSNG